MRVERGDIAIGKMLRTDTKLSETRMRSTTQIILRVTFGSFLIILTSFPALAQSSGQQSPRITQRVDEQTRVTLKGNTHPLAVFRNDRGPAPDTLSMNRMLLVLQRSPAQEAALKDFMDQQHSNSSENYQKWLTPEQFGAQYGPSDADIQTVSQWLQSHGFSVNRVAAGRMLIEFSGTAAQVREAFKTEIHKFVANGEEHWANASDPQIPAALAPVVVGVNTLHNFHKKPMSRVLGVFSRSKATGIVTPQFSFNGCGAQPCNALGPTDFATIYNILPLWNLGTPIDGTGQTIAIVGDSEINLQDVQKFRTLFGLPNSAVNVPTIIIDGPDPGFNGDEIEGDLDVEWSGSIAKNAKILFVIAQNTETAAGIDLAAEHIVDNNLAPVMSESFGACEAFLGTTGNLFYKTLWEQAAAQGITVIISSGDSGSAGCDAPADFSAAVNGFNVNGIASTPNNIAAGGTDFDSSVPNYQTTYWANSNNPVTGLSALQYIPEITWNDSCAKAGIAGCTNVPINSVFANTVGAGGGQSNCATSHIQGNFIFCDSAYTKPPWQIAPGVPIDGVRDLPDISLFSADGLASNSFYIICESDINPNGASCDLSAPFTNFVGVGGTSSSAPAFAGIMALINQKIGAGARQGNANFVLYPLAAAQNAANCNSTSGPNSACIFNDITKGNISVPCFGGSNDCSNTNGSSNALGIVVTLDNLGNPTSTPAFVTGTAYDLATGLGSINVNNLVNAWAGAVGNFIPTATTVCLSTTVTTCTPPTGPISIAHGTNVNIQVRVTPNSGPAATGDVALLGNCAVGPTCPFQNGSTSGGVDHFVFTGVTPTNTNIILAGNPTSTSTSFLVGGTYNLTAHYGGDGVRGASDSTPPIVVTVTPEGSSTHVSVLGVDLNTGNVTSNIITAPYGSLDLVRVDVAGLTSGQASGTGSVTLNDSLNGGPSTSLGTLNLTSDSFLEYQSPNISFPGNNAAQVLIPALTVGAHSFQAAYAGDLSFNGSNSASVAFTVTKAATASSVSASPSTTVVFGGNVTLTATVTTSGIGSPPTGSISFMNGNTILGSVNLTGTAATATTFSSSSASLMISPPATETVTAVYNGDANYTGVTSTGLLITVTGGPDFNFTSVSPNPTSITIAAPGLSGPTTITVTGTAGFTGTVTITCAVTPATLTDPPTCGITPSASINLTGAVTSGTATVTVFTTAAHATVFNPGVRPNPPGVFFLVFAYAMILVWISLMQGIPTLRRRRSAVILAVALFSCALTIVGCSKGSGTPPPPGDPGTTVGGYTLTVTGTNGGTVHTTTIPVTLQ
jgi:hypothetical protein